jgi:protein-S-isoprenylcysteine O-methyltransferase Ste14
MSALLIRAVALAPLLIALGAIVAVRPQPRRATGVFVAFLWNAVALFAVNVLALRFGWWTFHAEGGTLAGVPVDLLLGWAVLWSAIPLLLLDRVPRPAVVGALMLLDVFYMPQLEPVLVLTPRLWWLGEYAAVALALVPGLLLARWTEEDRRVHVRNVMLMITFGAITLVIVPLTVLQITKVSPEWESWPLILLLCPLSALLGVTAVQEFSTRGHGTPLPYDPPKRLVTSGIYAYVRNPMQLSATLLMLELALVLQSMWMLLASLSTVVYSAGLAFWDEQHDLVRFDGWPEYRDAVPLWRVRLRPWIARPATLYIAGGCNICQSLQRLIVPLNPAGLALVPAEEHPTRDLTRITYAPGDGSAEEEGIFAVARMLEHVNFICALLGFVMRLPGIAQVIQLVVDASGGEPRLVVSARRRAC